MALKKCEWCGRVAYDYTEIKDEFGNKHNVCASCGEKYNDSKCIECGKSEKLLLKGKCITCYQKEVYIKEKRKNEARLGVTDIFTSTSPSKRDTLNQLNEDGGYCAALDFSVDEYKSWIESQKRDILEGLGDLKNNTLLKRMWIITKILATGVSLENVDKYTKALEELLDATFDKLIGKECYVIIAETAELRRQIKNLNLIATDGTVFIVYA